MTPADTRPFLYSDGKMYNLNELIPRSSGWTLFSARDIKDRGQIISSLASWFMAVLFPGIVAVRVFMGVRHPPEKALQVRVAAFSRKSAKTEFSCLLDFCVEL